MIHLQDKMLRDTPMMKELVKKAGSVENLLELYRDYFNDTRQMTEGARDSYSIAVSAMSVRHYVRRHLDRTERSLDDYGSVEEIFHEMKMMQFIKKDL